MLLPRLLVAATLVLHLEDERLLLLLPTLLFQLSHVHSCFTLLECFSWVIFFPLEMPRFSSVAADATATLISRMQYYIYLICSKYISGQGLVLGSGLVCCFAV